MIDQRFSWNVGEIKKIKPTKSSDKPQKESESARQRNSSETSLLADAYPSDENLIARLVDRIKSAIGLQAPQPISVTVNPPAQQISVSPNVNVQPPNVTVNPAMVELTTPAPIVNVAAPSVTVNPAMVELTTPAPIVNVQPQAQPAPVVNVTTPAPIVNVQTPEQPAPIVNVTTPTPVVNVENKVVTPNEQSRTEVVERDQMGRAKVIEKKTWYEGQSKK